MEAEKGGKWGGKAIAKVKGAKGEQVWALFEDFCNFHKLHPGIDSCQHVEGFADQPGCVRYCAANANGGERWVKEKLLAIDPIGWTLSYEIVDNNIGFGAYVATFAVSASAAKSEEEGSTIEWSFAADPMEAWTEEGLLSYLQSSLQAMAKVMEEACAQAQAQDQ